MNLFLHVEQPCGLLLGDLADWHTRGGGKHLGNLLLADDGRSIGITFPPGRLALIALGDQVLLLIAQASSTLEVLLVDRGFLLQTNLGDLLVELAQIRRSGHALNPHARAGLVNKVDGLIRQKAILDIAGGKTSRGLQGVVSDGDAVVGFVAVAQPFKYVDSQLDARLVDLDGLETTLQSGVLLDVLAVLLESGGADCLQFATGKHRLQDAGRVNRALSSTSTNQSVNLVDEKHDVTTALNLLEHLLQALLEIAAISGTRHQRAEVQRVDLLIAQRLGNIAANDLLREALDDGGLTDARLADQNRIVLGATAEHRHHTLDFLLTANDRIEAILPSGLSQVTAELV